jgi:formate hydrogenlyase subunit 6/NADH:ubiquinone oxidoreductase subunit I
MILKEVLCALFRKPNTKKSFTKANEFVSVSESYRGRIQLDNDLCIGCLLCIKTCPTGAIGTVENKKVHIQLDKCIFCGQCKENCPKKAISFSTDFIMVATNRKELYISSNKKE